jgi:hypothetical protein
LTDKINHAAYSTIVFHADPLKVKEWDKFNRATYNQDRSQRMRDIITKDLNLNIGIETKFDFNSAYKELSKLGEECKRLVQVLSKGSYCHDHLESLATEFGLKQDLSNLQSIIVRFYNYKPAPEESITENDIVIYVQLLRLIQKKRNPKRTNPSRVSENNTSTNNPHYFLIVV